MLNSVKEEAKEIKLMSKGKATKYAKVPTVKQALKSLQLTQKEFVSNTSKEIEDFAKNNNCTVFQAVARLAGI